MIHVLGIDVSGRRPCQGECQVYFGTHSPKASVGVGEIQTQACRDTWNLRGANMKREREQNEKQNNKEKS